MARFARHLTALALLVVCLSSCQASNRLMRATPFAGDALPDPDRVNVWPLYYQTGDLVVCLWPIIDVDSNGFAVRPIIAKEKNEWSVLHPLAGWDTEAGTWWALPAYHLRDNSGFAPLWNFGDWNHVGLAWWLVNERTDETTDWGVFPLFARGEINHVGPVWWGDGEVEPRPWGVFPILTIEGNGGYFVPVWWRFNADEEFEKFGVFPIMSVDADGGYFLPAWWRFNAEDELEDLAVFPLFLYQDKGAYERLITPLGGRSWGADGEPGFVNVLGPVFHRSTNGEQTYTTFLWPIFAWEDDAESRSMRAFPVFHYSAGEDWSSFSMAAGLINRSKDGEGRKTRFAPLFTHNVGMSADVWDVLTLYSRRESLDGEKQRTRLAPLFSYNVGHATELTDLFTLFGYRVTPARDDRPERTSFHLGTPLLFHRDAGGQDEDWGGLFNLIEYESRGDQSSFSLLYYLYRQESHGEETRRDLFPFLTWDSGADSVEVSFLWRLLRYEREGKRRGGYFLFLPLGDV